MSRFAASYSEYVKTATDADRFFGFDVDAVAKIEPVLSFLYKDWWRVDFKKLERLPSQGPALIVGNSAGLIPSRPALMLIYALIARRKRRGA